MLSKDDFFFPNYFSCFLPLLNLVGTKKTCLGQGQGVSLVKRLSTDPLSPGFSNVIHVTVIVVFCHISVLRDMFL